MRQYCNALPFDIFFKNIRRFPKPKPKKKKFNFGNKLRKVKKLFDRGEYRLCCNVLLTSFVCPWKDLIGLSVPSLQTCMHLSVEHDAKLSSVCQSTSKAGAE